MALLQTKSGLSGQYGYVNGAPILNASVAQSLLGNEFYKPLDIAENQLGWGTNSKYLGSIVTGAGLYGVKGKRDEIVNLLDVGEKFKQDLNAGKIRAFTDPESGQISYRSFVSDQENGGFYGNPIQQFGDETTAQDNFQKWQDTTQKLQSAAQTLGIDTKGMTDRQLLDAINAKDTRVAVTGRTQFWDATQSGIGGQEGPQHATVVYTQQDGKLVPVAPPKTFEFQDPNTTSGFLGDVIGGLASILSVPPIAAALGAYAFGPGGLLGGEQAAAPVFESVAVPAADVLAGAATPSAIPSAAAAVAPSLLETVNFPTSLVDMGGGTGLTPGAAGQGLQVPTMPNLANMGGAQGLTVPVTGGTIGALGLTPTGATSVLGSPSSFINNPDVLGQPVIQQGTPTSPISVQDALRAANLARQLANGGQQPQQQAPQQMAQGGATGVDYSSLLNLLASRARTSGLLGTQFQPQPINLSSLLG